MLASVDASHACCGEPALYGWSMSNATNVMGPCVHEYQNSDPPLACHGSVGLMRERYARKLGEGKPGAGPRISWLPLEVMYGTSDEYVETSV